MIRPLALVNRPATWTGFVKSHCSAAAKWTVLVIATALPIGAPMHVQMTTPAVWGGTVKRVAVFN